MKEQITDTDRLNFIEKHYNYETVLKVELEPHCRCFSCRSWCIEINEETYFGYASLRSAIDEAIKECKCNDCKENRK